MNTRGREEVGGRRSPVPSVLVVHIDPHIRYELSGWLRDAGYRVQDAGNFPTGRRLMKIGVPDLVIAGLRLQEYNGLHLIIAARALSSSSRGIVLLRSEDTAAAREARSQGAQVLLEPVTRDALLAAAGALQPAGGG